MHCGGLLAFWHLSDAAALNIPPWKRNKSADCVVPRQIYAPRNTFFLFFDSFLLLSFSIQLKVKSIYFPGQEAREPIGCHNASQLKISNRTNSKHTKDTFLKSNQQKAAAEEEDMRHFAREQHSVRSPIREAPQLAK